VLIELVRPWEKQPLRPQPLRDWIAPYVTLAVGINTQAELARESSGSLTTITGAKLYGTPTGVARGLGAALGTASSDRIVTSLTTSTTARTFIVRLWERASTGITSRAFDQWYGANGAGELTGTYGDGLYLYQRPFSTAGGDWRWTGPGYGKWTNLVLSHDGSSTSNVPLVFHDGFEKTVSVTTAPIGTVGSADASLYIGNRGGNDRIFDGMVEALIVLNVALPSALCRDISADLYGTVLEKSRRRVFLAAAGPTFQPAWARNSNVVIQ